MNSAVCCRIMTKEQYNKEVKDIQDSHKARIDGLVKKAEDKMNARMVAFETELDEQTTSVLNSIETDAAEHRELLKSLRAKYQDSLFETLSKGLKQNKEKEEENPSLAAIQSLIEKEAKASETRIDLVKNTLLSSAYQANIEKMKERRMKMQVLEEEYIKLNHENIELCRKIEKKMKTHTCITNKISEETRKTFEAFQEQLQKSETVAQKSVREEAALAQMIADNKFLAAADAALKEQNYETYLKGYQEMSKKDHKMLTVMLQDLQNCIEQGQNMPDFTENIAKLSDLLERKAAPLPDPLDLYENPETLSVLVQEAEENHERTKELMVDRVSFVSVFFCLSLFVGSQTHL